MQTSAALLPDLKVKATDHYALSHKEKGKFYLYQMADRCLNPEIDQEVRGFNVVVRYTIDDLDLALCEEAFRLLVARHDQLRAVFRIVNGNPVKIILDPTEGPNVEIIEIDNEECPDSMLEWHVKQVATTRFDFAGPKLWRAVIVKNGSRSTLVLSINHIIADQWSILVLKNDFMTIYESLMNGCSCSLVPITSSGALIGEVEKEIAETAEGREARDYWRRSLFGKLPVFLLRDFYRDPVYAEQSISYAGKLKQELEANYRDVTPRDFSMMLGHLHRASTLEGRSYRMPIERNLYEKILALAQRNHATVFHVIMTAFYISWRFLTGSRDIVIGFDKSLVGDKFLNTVGWLINTLLIRVNVGREVSVSGLIGIVKDNIHTASEHQSYPFDKVLQMHDVSIDAVGSLYVNYINDRNNRSAFDDLLPRHMEETSPSYFDIDAFIRAYSNGLEVILRYKAHLFQPTVVERIGRLLKSTLSEMVASPYQPLSKLNVED